MLTKALDTLKKKHEETVVKHKKELKAQLAAQKKEYDTVLERYIP